MFNLGYMHELGHGMRQGRTEWRYSVLSRVSQYSGNCL